jgi:hypothetical protein
LTVNGGCDTRIEAVVGGANAWNCKSINWPLNAKKKMKMMAMADLDRS